MPYKSKPEPERLIEFLDSYYTVPLLRQLAALVAKGIPTRKAELVLVVETAMSNAGKLLELWKKLDTLQQAAISETLYSGKLVFDADGFRAKYGRDPAWGKLQEYGESNPELLRLFLHNNRLPRDLAERLKSLVPQPKKTRIQSTAELPKTVTLSWKQFDYRERKHQEMKKDVPLLVCETERMAQQDLYAVLRLIDAGKVRVSDKTQRPTAASTKAIAQVLHGGDFYPDVKPVDEWTTEPGDMKAFAWPLIVQSARMATASGGKLQLTPAGKKALTTPAHKTLQTAWNRWLKTTMLDELNRVNAIRGQTGKGKRSLTAPSGRRETIVKAMTECLPQQWVTFEAFSRFMRASGHRFTVTRDAWTLYIEEAGYGSLGYEGFGGWNILQERYMLAFLFEYAATMGIIDVAYIHPAGARRDHHQLWGADSLDCLSRYDGLQYFRINALGAWCLGLVDSYTPSRFEEKAVFKVLPNREVVAIETLSAGDALFLEQVGTKTSDNVWKLDEKKLLERVEEGHPIADTVAFLRAKADGTLPDNVVIFLEDIAARASRLKKIGPALLIEASDALLAKQLSHEAKLKSLCMLAGEKHLVVPAESESAFRRALLQLGYAMTGARVS